MSIGGYKLGNLDRLPYVPSPALSLCHAVVVSTSWRATPLLRREKNRTRRSRSSRVTPVASPRPSQVCLLSLRSVQNVPGLLELLHVRPGCGSLAFAKTCSPNFIPTLPMPQQVFCLCSVLALCTGFVLREETQLAPLWNSFCMRAPLTDTPSFALCSKRSDGAFLPAYLPFCGSQCSVTPSHDDYTAVALHH